MNHTLQNWQKVEQEIKKKLKDHKYSFIEVWKIVGCGEKTLRRYMDAELLMPIKTCDEWYFTQQQLDKCNFIHKMKSNHYMTAKAAAGIFDYLVDKRYKINTDAIVEAIKYYD